MGLVYDPFVRGPFPVGVRGGELIHRPRANRALPFEVSYPAPPRYAGLDLSASTQDSFTVVQDTLLLVAGDDQSTPLDGQYELFERTPASKQMFILRHADHLHFGDQIDDPGECPAETAQRFTRGLSLAHMDAVLAEREAARHFLADDPVAALREVGVEVAGSFLVVADVPGLSR